VADIPEDPPEYRSMTLRTTTGRREFVIDQTEIASTDGDVLGRAYQFRDVTDRKTREQRLQVLNRVIRHNLRNDLDAIRGFAEPIRDDDIPAEEAAQYFDRIDTLASGLVSLADAVDRSEHVLTGEHLERDQCDLLTIAQSVAAAVTDADVTLNIPEDAKLRSDPDAIELVLTELLDNAVTHSDRTSPSVVIRIRSTEAGAEIAVADDGPGIPPEERTVLREGEEIPIRHSRGLGLWLVSWTVTRLGGALSFEERDPRGSIVIVDLPDLEQSNRFAPPDG
jgi:signal transduction histidine kinase